MKKNNSELSNSIYLLKAVAILSVVTAHTNVSADNFTMYIFNYFGVVGVGLFFILSGYLFYYDKSDLKSFFKKKIKTIIVPWIVLGSAVYLYMWVRKNDYMGYMDFMVGNGSYLYFMSLLIFFFIFFYKLKSSSIAVVMSITFSVIYILLASENSMNPYLNPLNFMMYFSLGILLAKYDLFETLIKKSKSHRTYIILSYTLFILLLTNKSIVIHYWDPLIIPLQMFSLLAIFSVINYFKDAKIMRDIGKATLYIYLLHMPFAGIMSHVILYVDNYVLTIIAPLIIVFTTYYVIVVFRKYTKMVNCIK